MLQSTYQGTKVEEDKEKENRTCRDRKRRMMKKKKETKKKKRRRGKRGA